MGYGATRASSSSDEGRPEDYHPRYSPVGDTCAPLGGSYLAGRLPRPLQDAR